MPLYLYPAKNWYYMYTVVRPLEFAFTARIISLVPRAISELCPPSKNFSTPCAKFKNEILRTLPQKAGLHGVVPVPTFCNQTRSLLVGLSLLGGSPTFDGKRAQKTGSGTCTIYVESCNKVTPKSNRVTLKEQSELTKNQTHFGTLPTLPSKGVYRIQIFPPFYLAKERRAISAKERGRSCALRPSSN